MPPCSECNCIWNSCAWHLPFYWVVAMVIWPLWNQWGCMTIASVRSYSHTILGHMTWNCPSVNKGYKGRLEDKNLVFTLASSHWTKPRKTLCSFWPGLGQCWVAQCILKANSAEVPHLAGTGLCIILSGWCCHYRCWRKLSTLTAFLFSGTFWRI